MKVNKERFSRAFVLRELEIRINNIQARRSFTTQTGYKQVEGKGEEINRDYAKWDAYRSLISEFRE